MTTSKELSKEQATQIYKYDFWNSINGDQIESGNVALITYDMQVNHGARNTALIIQQAINKLGGNLVIDRKWGPQTLQTLHDFSLKEEQTLCEAILKERENFYQQIITRVPSQRSFLNGWNNRISELRKQINH